MTRPFVTFVESNVKTGCRANLGPKTVIVGPNGTGKSTVANSIELCLTGTVSDLVGRREVAQEVGLMALAPSKKIGLAARARLSDGREVSWKVGGKTKKGVHTFPSDIVNPATALPLRPVYSAVLGNAETARKFFMQYAVGAVGDADVLARIPGALHALYKRATLTTPGDLSAVDRLLSALEASKKSGRDAATAAKAAEGSADTTASGLAPLPTEAEETGLRDTLRAAEAARTALHTQATQRETLAGAVAEHAEITDKLKLAEHAYLTAKQDADAAAHALASAPVPQAADPNVQAFRTVLAMHAARGLAACECCGRMGVNGPYDSAYWQDRLAGLDAFLASQATAAQAYEALKIAVTTTAMRAEQAYNEGKALYARLTAINDVLGAHVVEAPSAEAIAAADAQVTSLTEKLRAVDSLKAAWAVASRARDTVVEAKRVAQEWKDLTEACTAAVAALLDGGVTTFVTRVQAALPSTDKYDLTLRDGDRAVFQFGLHKEGVLRTALSGAEWSRVMAAMAAACAPRPDHVSVVIPEERAFDSMTLSLVLAAFSTLDSQVVVTTPVMPTTVAPGWLLLSTINGDHTNGSDPVTAPVAVTDGVVPLERQP